MQKFAVGLGKISWSVRALFPRLALCCGAAVMLLAGAAHAQPLNDNFTNAIVVSGLSGTTSGKNSGATLQTGEANMIATPDDGTVTVGNSVWYQWTAPYSGNVTFDTLGSVDANFNPMDTVLAAYIGNSFAQLKFVSTNDNAPGTVNSSMTFYATAGLTYYVAIYVNVGNGGVTGNYTLNWNELPAPIGGQFHMTSAQYQYSTLDGNTSAEDPRGGITEFGVPARVTLTRIGGASGMVDVGYYITNTWYTNFLITNIYQTNIYVTTVSSNGTPLNTTNYVSSLYNAIEAYQNYTVQAGYFYTWLLSSANDSFTNVNGQPLPLGYYSAGYYTNGLPYVTNAPDICGSPSTSGVTTNADLSVSTWTTNYYCGRIVVTNLISSFLGFQFPAGGTAVFNDFQMNEDISIPFTDDNSGNPYLENPLLFVVAYTNYLDPLEDQTIPAPTLDTNRNIATVVLLDDLADPVDFGANALTNVVINFERSTVRCEKTVGGHFVAYVAVNISQATSQTRTAYYHIDYNPNDASPDHNNFFNLQAGSDYARPDDADWYIASSDFTGSGQSGMLTWPAYDGTPKYIQIPITQDDFVKFNRDIMIQLWIPPGVQPSSLDAVYGDITDCYLTEIYTTPTAGACDIYYNSDNTPTTSPPNNMNPGANGVVYASAVQPTDGKAIIGGDFTSYNSSSGANRNHIARLALNGQLDATFNPGSGFDADVRGLVVDTNSNVIAVGEFHSYNGSLRPGIVRITPTGAIDGSFVPGTGANSTVWATAIQPDGQILIAGDFTTYNGTNRAYIARLNQDGSVDPTFDPGTGPNSDIYSMAVQTNGQIVIGGAFNSVDGTNLNYIARLNADGTLDTSFNPGYGFGADNIVNAVAVQANGQILVGGLFKTVGNIGGAGIARLNTDGSVDTSFNSGTGFSDEVNTIDVETNGTIMVGGWFTSYNQTRRIGLARLLSNGLLDTSFLDTAYNQFAGVINNYYDPSVNPPNPIYTISVQDDGNVLVGGSFYQVGGGGSSVPTGGPDSARDEVHPRQNFARLVGGVTPGPGNVELSTTSYSADSASPSFFVQVDRTNGSLGAVSATVSTIPTGSGTGYAANGVDYSYTPTSPVWGSSWSAGGGETWMLADGLFGTNNNEVGIDGEVQNFANPITITIISNANNNVSLDLAITQPAMMDTFFLGGASSGSTAGFGDPTLAEGENIPLGVGLGTEVAPMTIIHNNPHPGIFNFSASYYYVGENAANAVITVTRTGGTDGNVSVHYATSDGTAVANTDYRAASGTLSLVGGQASATFQVPIINGPIARADRIFNLKLSIPGNGSALGSTTNAQVEIINDNFTAGHIEFAAGNITQPGPAISFGTNENAGPIQVTLARLGGDVGNLNVTLSTVDGTAKNNVNFVGITNTVTWTNGDASLKTINLQLIDDGVVTTNLSATLRLSNPIVSNTNAPQALSLGGSLTNATIVITNTDNPGTVEFTSSSYTVNENAGYAIVPVVRVGGSIGSLSIAYSTVSGTAVGGVNYASTNGILTFAPGEVSTNFIVWIHDLGTPWVSPLNFQVVLTNAPGTSSNALGAPVVAQMNINGSDAYNQPPGQPNPFYNPSAGFNNSVFALALQADGKLLAGGDFTFANGIGRNRIARLNTDGSLDTSFSSFLPQYGANSTVRALAVQDNGLILVGGSFTNINSSTLNFIARLNPDSTLDGNFNNVGAGANNPVYALASTYANGARVSLLGGSFTAINGYTENAIARLLDNGSVDKSFNSGLGANGTVYALAVQTDGKIVIGGDFTAVNGTNLNHIARLNANGSLDSSFNVGSGASGSVRAIALQLDGRILIGGLFTNVSGTNLNYIARLNANGSVDPSFNVGAGGNGTVASIAVQSDTRIIVTGNFTQFSGVTRNGVTRLNPDGTVDPTINFGTGADGYVAASVIESDGNIDLGGTFLDFNNQSHPYFVQIYGGSLAGTGAFQIGASSYYENENGSNALITIVRTGGTSGTNANGSGNMYVKFYTTNESAVAGVNYSSVVTNVSFAPGEVEETVAIPVFDDGVVTTNLTVGLVLTNIPSSAAVIGSIPSATLYIINDDSSINFASTTYLVAKNSPSGVAGIGLIRNGSETGVTTVNFLTTTNGSALTNVDYTPVIQTVTFGPGISNMTVNVPIINNNIPEGSRTVGMVLTNFVGSYPASPTNATLTIIDTVSAPGQLAFSTNNYYVVKSNTNIYLTVVRTNGMSGIVSANYTTVVGTASPNFNYVTTSGTLTLADQVTSGTIAIPILNNNLAQGTVNFTVNLFNPQGGATLTYPSNAVVNIVDQNVGVSFQTATNYISETAGSVNIFIQRVGATNSTFSVNYATTPYTALPGTNYTSISNTITFAKGQTVQAVSIPILNDPAVTGPVTFGVNLSGATGGTQIVAPTNTTVVILDANAGLSFTNSTTTVLKDAGFATITVVCSNPSVEPVIVNSNTIPLQVSYFTTNGTAVAGVDYTAESGTLVFTNGNGTNTFTVPIINNSTLEGNRSFNVVLANPTAPGQLVSPSTETVTIVDINARVAFSSPTYTVAKTGIQANISVYRSGYTSNTVTVNYSATNGTANAYVNFVPVSGTLVFTNGATLQQFSVPIISSTVVQPDLTVFLQLSDATNAGLAYPSFATLTIVDLSGSSVVPAGVVLLKNQLPTNGVAGIIYPETTNVAQFAFRESSGTNVGNLIATLLSANGVAPTNSGETQTYGSLMPGGHSVARPFAFVSSGTNGQLVQATFQLMDGTKNIGTNSFSFNLGTWQSSFSNTAPIIINAFTTASPYPSIINVSGLAGVVLKTTVTMTNIDHTRPADIEALVVAPSQANTILMNNVGGANSLQNVTLTFDDAATNYLPLNLPQIVTSTNKPTAYPTINSLP